MPRWVIEVEKGSLEAMPISTSSIFSTRSSGRAVGTASRVAVLEGAEIVVVAVVLVSMGAAAMEATMAIRVTKEVSLTMMDSVVV